MQPDLCARSSTRGVLATHTIADASVLLQEEALVEVVSLPAFPFRCPMWARRLGGS